MQLLGIRKGINNCVERGGNPLREAFRRLGDRFPSPCFSHNRFGFFRRPGLAPSFAIVPFLLEVFAFLFAFEAVLLRVFLAIVDPQCRTRLYSEHRRRMGHRARADIGERLDDVRFTPKSRRQTVLRSG